MNNANVSLKNPIKIPLDLTFHLLYNLFAKKLIKKLHVDDTCTGCGLCEKICPVDNITLVEDLPIFADRCFFCMRCISQCPQKSIQIGKMTQDKFRWKGPKGKYNSKKYNYH